MTIKSYGEVLEDAEEECCHSKYKESMEYMAQAVIKEFCKRNSEPVGYISQDDHVALQNTDSNHIRIGVDTVIAWPKDQIPYNWLKPIFLAPQPKEMMLPSEIEITKEIYKNSGNYLDATKAILKMLEEKNK